MWYFVFVFRYFHLISSNIIYKTLSFTEHREIPKPKVTDVMYVTLMCLSFFSYFFLLFIVCYFTVSTERVSAQDGSALPSVRDISNAVFKATDTETPGEGFNTLMSLNWGQFLDHDIVLTPTYTGKCLSRKTLDKPEGAL